MLKSLERLRDSLVGYQAVTGEDMGAFLLHADAIQAEVDERCMELPLDIDGVPIHPGDELEYCSDDIIDVSGKNLGNVSGRERIVYIAFDGHGCTAIQDEKAEADDEPPLFFRSHDDMNYRHAKPRTVEDVLEDFSKSLGCKSVFVDIKREAIAKYAAELRMRDAE